MRAVHVLAATILIALTTRVASAQESCSGFVRHAFGDDDKCASTAKQAVVISLFAASLVSSGIAIGYEVHAKSLVSKQHDMADLAGGDQFVCRNGPSSAACLAYSEARDDAHQATDRRTLFLATGATAMLGALVTVLVWPNQKTSAAPPPVSLGLSPSSGGSVASITGYLPF
jgi:hypothetical protein